MAAVFFLLSLVFSIAGVAVVLNRWCRNQEPSGFDYVAFFTCLLWAVITHVAGQVAG